MSLTNKYSSESAEDLFKGALVEDPLKGAQVEDPLKGAPVEDSLKGDPDPEEDWERSADDTNSLDQVKQRLAEIDQKKKELEQKEKLEQEAQLKKEQRRATKAKKVQEEALLCCEHSRQLDELKHAESLRKKAVRRVLNSKPYFTFQNHFGDGGFKRHYFVTSANLNPSFVSQAIYCTRQNLCKDKTCKLLHRANPFKDPFDKFVMAEAQRLIDEKLVS
jgi:hypothetical protein